MIYRSSPFFVHLFVDKQTLAHALTWRRSVTTRNYDASQSLQATFSDDSFWALQVTIIHPMYYMDQISKTRKWYIIFNDKFLCLLFKHRKRAVVTNMLHKIIINVYPSASHSSWPLIERANGGRNCFLCLVSCSWNVSFVMKKSAKTNSANPDDGIYIRLLKQTICVVWEYSVCLVLEISVWFDHTYPIR